MALLFLTVSILERDLGKLLEVVLKLVNDVSAEEMRDTVRLLDEFAREDRF